MATEKRLIDVCKAITEMNQIDTNSAFDDKDDILEKCVNLLHTSPTVYAVEVVHGRWEKHTIPGYDYFGVPALIPIACNCSVCGRDGRNETPYCPNCGAKMDGE